MERGSARSSAGVHREILPDRTRDLDWSHEPAWFDKALSESGRRNREADVLVKGREIFRLIDGTMHLRVDLDKRFRKEPSEFEEQRQIPSGRLD